MKKIVGKTEYRTRDGRSFETERAAAQHEELIDLRDGYELAKQALGRKLAETFKTADGQPFSVGLWTEYYWITPGHFSLPALLSVDFWGRNWTWEENGEGDTLVLISHLNDRGEDISDRQGRRFPINELFANRAKAKAELANRQRAWLQEKLTELNGTASN
ncbi:MAG: hypothetical protein WC107_06175 [Patescibacteria group bacterium]